MGTLDAKFNGQIFRKDNPIILACRRDQASFISIRVPYDASGYLPGQVLAYNDPAVTNTVPGDGLYYKWNGSLGSAQGSVAVSGAGLNKLVVLFDQATNYDQISDGSGLAGVSGASLLRGLVKAEVYTNQLIGYNSTAKSNLIAKDSVDAGGVGITIF